jgi:hypothetical protein
MTNSTGTQDSVNLYSTFLWIIPTAFLIVFYVRTCQNRTAIDIVQLK